VENTILLYDKTIREIFELMLQINDGIYAYLMDVFDMRRVLRLLRYNQGRALALLKKKCFSYRKIERW
jgi:hypothetical protein